METKAYWNDGSGRGVFVLGWQFGPMLLADETTCEQALDEFDERFGERVESDDPALANYDGIEGAMNCGDVRVNSGGTMVWADPYEWIREFPSVEAAMSAFEAYPTWTASVRASLAPRSRA